MSIRYVYYKSDGTSQTRREIVEELDQENHLTAATTIWDRMVAFYNGYLDPSIPLKYRIQRIYIGSAGINESRNAKDLYFHYDLSNESKALMEKLLKFNSKAVVHLLPKSHFMSQLLDKVSAESIDPTTQEPIYPVLFHNGRQVEWEETPSGLGIVEVSSDEAEDVPAEGNKSSAVGKGVGILAAVVGVIAAFKAFRR